MSDHEHNWIVEEVSLLLSGGVSTKFRCTICGMRRTSTVNSALLEDTLPTIPEPGPGEHRHCWHSTGVMQLSNPPRYGYQCCMCGENKYFFASEFIPSRPAGHGPFVPNSLPISL